MFLLLFAKSINDILTGQQFHRLRLKFEILKFSIVMLCFQPRCATAMLSFMFSSQMEDSD